MMQTKSNIRNFEFKVYSADRRDQVYSLKIKFCRDFPRKNFNSNYDNYDIRRLIVNFD